ncbi:MAG: GtrA family protein [Clostridia bacterium]|nr:GtrA family protein [Clostridia bacterium]
MNSIKELYKKYKEIVDYLFWGVMSTVVSWGTYALFSLVFGTLSENVVLTTTLANALSIACAVAFAYVANKLWVFGSKSWAREVVVPELTKFLSARAVTAVIEMAGVPLLIALGLGMSVFGIDGMIAKVIVSVVVVLLNYIFSKLFIFKKEK